MIKTQTSTPSRMSMVDGRATFKERAEDLLFREFLHKGVSHGWTLDETVERLKDAARARGVIFTGRRKVMWFHGDHPNVISALDELMCALADNMLGPVASSDTAGESSKNAKTKDKAKGNAKA